MGKRVIKTFVCDLAHDDGRERPASETLRFGVEGRSYAIDLCAEHADEVHGDLSALVAAARRGRGRGR